MKKALLVLIASAACTAFAQSAPSGYLPLDQYQSSRPVAQQAPAKATFEVVRGASLRATLEAWARQAGWQPLVWKLPEETDFTLGAAARFEGDFMTATRSFVDALGSEAQIRVRFNLGNRLAVVEPLQ